MSLLRAALPLILQSIPIHQTYIFHNKNISMLFETVIIDEIVRGGQQDLYLFFFKKYRSDHCENHETALWSETSKTFTSYEPMLVCK